MLGACACEGELLVTVRIHSRLVRLLAVGVTTGLWMVVLPNAGVSVSSTDVRGALSRPVSMVRPLRSPTGVIATATDAQAVVRWSMPAAEGGPPISTYVVTTVPPGLSAAVPATQQSAVFNGLRNGTAYSFEVAASNPAGAGPESKQSNVVRPSRLVSVASTVSLKSVNAMFNGGMCLYGGVECFGNSAEPLHPGSNCAVLAPEHCLCRGVERGMVGGRRVPMRSGTEHSRTCWPVAGRWRWGLSVPNAFGLVPGTR